MRGALLLVLVVAACSPSVAPIPSAASLSGEVQGGRIDLESPGLALASADPDRLAVLTADGVQWSRATWMRRQLPTPQLLGLDGLEDPRDLDVTNGQDLYIADGSRVLRFSGEGRLVQTLDIPALDRLEVAVTGQTGRAGEAVSVAAGAEERVFVLESTRGVVQVWREGSLTDVLGGLGRPVALASEGRRLIVADAEADVVRVLDPEGLPLKTLSADALTGIRSVSLSEDHVVVLARDAVGLFAMDGTLQRVVPVSGGATLLDAVVRDGSLVVLTPDGVYVLGRLRE